MKFIPIALASLLTLATAGCERAQPLSSAPAPLPARSVAQARAESQPAPPERSALAALDSIPDSLITARVRAELLGDSDLSGTDISVNTDRGVVILTGSVKSREQAVIASAHAQRQDGVMRIDNHLSVNME
jgi:hyperosmotically inducible protein